jgi:tRNA splicing endonuclease
VPESPSDPYEEAYALIKENGDWLGALNALEKRQADFVVFLVYYDLKRRGKRVRPGPRPRTLLLEDRPGKIAEILVLSEGTTVRPLEIAEWSRLAVSDSHDPVVAVVDESGGVTYYEARTVKELT